MIMKKMLSLFASALILGSILTGCGGNQNADTNKSNAENAAGPETTVTVWVQDAEDNEPTSEFGRLSEWAKNFNDTNPDKIKVVVSGNHSPSDILTVISSESTPDIFYNFWNNTPSWAAAGAILDLTDYIKNTPDYDADDFLPYALKMAASADGVQYAIPWQVSTSALFYNKDMLAEAGYSEAPKTLDELLDIQDKLTVIENGTVKQAGIIPDVPWLEMVGWSVASGANWADEQGNVTFDTAEMKRSYQLQADMYQKMGGYDAGQQFVSTLGKLGEATDPILNGKVAMLYLPDNMINSFVANGKDVNWGIAPLPSDDGEQMMTVGTFAINAKSKNPDAAWSVLADLTSKDSMAKYQVPGLNGNGKLMSRVSALTALKDGENYYEENRSIAENMLNAKMRGFTVSSYINEYLNAISEQMSEAIAGRISVDDAAAKVQKTVEDIAARSK